MLYDIRLTIGYDYGAPSDRARTLLRVMPVDLPGQQRVVSRRLDLRPAPNERHEGRDFFGNATTLAVWHGPLAALELTVTLRVERIEPPPALADLSPTLAALRAEILALRDLGADSPLHALTGSPRIAASAPIAAFARAATAGARSTLAMARALAKALHTEMTFDPKATQVDTLPEVAFAARRGVCQDYAQVMIGGLRALGIPALYVSGFLRTDPPPGQPRLEGVDAMHAWVRVWCGAATGWVDLDPTNDRLAGVDYVTVARGRDYGDVAPVLGAMRTAGRQDSRQAVDVVPVAG